ncbi:MAG: hypothetical protein OXU54_07940 [Gammaproteobacteria bacterium]|nr:hypothetical protein [Gammaproteobacteria bacterium]
MAAKYLRERAALTKRHYECIDRAVRSDMPLQFLILWGKGEKRIADGSESRACDWLSAYAGGVVKAWSPGVLIDIICCDTHARLNGYGKEEIREYFESLAGCFKRLNASVRFMSRIWKRGGLDLERIKNLAFKHTFDDWSRLAGPKVNLVAMAEKCTRSDHPIEAARLYCAARTLEHKILEKMFSGHLFVTSDRREFLLQPALPILRITSWGKRSVKPWHIRNIARSVA